MVVALCAGGAVAAPAAFTIADSDGDTMIARARAAEAAQLRALAGSSIALHTRGFVNDGKTTRRIESFRRLDYRADGTAANEFQRGLVDGRVVTEEELRRAIGAPAHPDERQRDMLSGALAPLHADDIAVTAVGPTPDGGYALHCRISDGTLVSGMTLIVDGATGRKRTALLEMAGLKARLADRLENILTYGPDGAPAEFRSRFHAKLVWIERSAEFHTQRISGNDREAAPP